jgi:hypothetical protein
MDLGMTLKLDYAAQREAVPGLDGWLAGWLGRAKGEGELTRPLGPLFRSK